MDVYLKDPEHIRLANYCSLGLALLGSAILGGLSVFRHDRFASNGVDLGIFDQLVWGYSRGQIVPNTVRGFQNLLGDHFHPILVLLGPFYWIWEDVRMLLLLQGVFLAAACF